MIFWKALRLSSFTPWNHSHVWGFLFYLHTGIALQVRYHFCLYNWIIGLNLQLQSFYQSFWQHFTAIQQERLKTKTTGLPTRQMWLQLCTSVFRLQGNVYHLLSPCKIRWAICCYSLSGEKPRREHIVQAILCVTFPPLKVNTGVQKWKLTSSEIQNPTLICN